MLFLALTAAGLAGQVTTAECEMAASDIQRSRCLLRELESADDRINASYATARGPLAPTDRLALRDAQRAWIKHRDAVCRLTAEPATRGAWLAELAQDYAKTVCVVRFSNERARELERRIAAPPSAAPVMGPRPVAPSAAPLASAASAAHIGGNVYDLVARTPRSTGKWYFESEVNIGDLARESERALFVGVRTQSQSIGTLLTLHKRDVGRDALNIGVAVDLDAGKLYIRENGKWRGGGPGESGGQDLKLGRPYQGWISSSTALDQAIQRHSLDTNFGQRAFVYAVPDGYRPIDTQPPMTRRED